METNFLKTMISEVVFYSVFNSFIVYGILQTILKVVNKETISRFWGLGITYVLGMIFGFMLYNQLPTWQKIIYGIGIGSASVACYKSAISSLLQLIPAVTAKIIGVSAPTASTLPVEDIGTEHADTPTQP